MRYIQYRRNIFVITAVFAAAVIMNAETNLAKYNLQLAYDSYLDGRAETARLLSQRAYGYDSTLPEYYYLMNLMTSDSEDTVYQKTVNSRAIMTYLSGHYFIPELTLLRNAVANLHASDELDAVYDKIIAYQDHNDYLLYIDHLLRTHRYSQALSVIRSIETTVNSVVLKAYEVLARIRIGSYPFAEFSRDILALRSNRYDASAILLYRALYTQELPNELVDEYRTMSAEGRLNSAYRLPILEAFLSNKMLQTPAVSVSDYFDIEQLDESEQALYEDTSNDSIIAGLLDEWAFYGGLENAYTDVILTADEYRRIICSSDRLTDKYMHYTGVRLADYDDNHIWESRITYRDGAVACQEYDANQDGISERIFVYDAETGLLNRAVLQNDKTCREFTVNSGDQSVSECRDSDREGIRPIYLITFMKSAFLLNNHTPYESQLTPNVYRRYIESVEYLRNGIADDDFIHRKEMYDRGVNICTYIDEDNNGIFDRQIFYRDGRVADMLRDLDEDGYYEVRDIYKDNRYIGTECRKSEFDKHCYYMEMLSDKNVKKQWDYDDDGYADSILTEPLEHKTPAEKAGKWTVVSVRDPNLVSLPDDIVITDRDHNSGYYVHDSKKLVFRDGRLTDAPYNLEVRVIGSRIYLFDLNN